MNPIYVVLFISVIGSLTAFASYMKKERFKKGASGQAAKETAEKYAKEFIKSDEKLFLSDYSMDGSYIVISDIRVYYVNKKGTAEFSYDDVVDIKFFDYKGNSSRKYKGGDILLIKIWLEKQKINLSSFTRMEYLASELSFRVGSFD